MTKRFLTAATLVIALLLPSVSQAVPVGAREIIADPRPFEAFARDLTRTRTDSTGTTVETNDATITAENNVSSNFGIWSTSDVTYTHDLTWIDPAAGTFLALSLTIEAWGTDGTNDAVYADTHFLGNISGDGSFLEKFETFNYSSTSVGAINAVLADGMLNIRIDKRGTYISLGRFGGFTIPDKSSIYKSTLAVRYEPVPEPATMLLLGSGLVGMGIRRRKKLSAF